MKQIPLTRGKIALVDDNDYETLSKHSWQARKISRSWYAARYDGRKCVYMHRQILGFPDSEVDHADCDGLNNQRSNLRLATRTENNRNNRKRLACSSKYKGVCWDKSRNKWTVHIAAGAIRPSGGHKYRHLGRFNSEVLAALAYDEAARQAFGEFARLNFPDPDPIELATAIEKLAAQHQIQSDHT